MILLMLLLIDKIDSNSAAPISLLNHHESIFLPIYRSHDWNHHRLEIKRAKQYYEKRNCFLHCQENNQNKQSKT